MSAGAVVMMIVAMAVVWGGLLAAVLRLRGHTEEY
ncbi:methionine/alanine import family NSS transporter small subunit [Streptomyces sp. CNQ085]|nr:methionine/alanine import family NSS transporter small subunit [Streptomyces sp. CNQ085]MCI0386035.1 methionine/alanine import family NSS transporter small subunit [Streptomyces sp. CNQ085]